MDPRVGISLSRLDSNVAFSLSNWKLIYLNGCHDIINGKFSKTYSQKLYSQKHNHQKKHIFQKISMTIFHIAFIYIMGKLKFGNLASQDFYRNADMST